MKNAGLTIGMVAIGLGLAINGLGETPVAPAATVTEARHIQSASSEPASHNMGRPDTSSVDSQHARIGTLPPCEEVDGWEWFSEIRPLVSLCEEPYRMEVGVCGPPSTTSVERRRSAPPFWQNWPPGWSTSHGVAFSARTEPDGCEIPGGEIDAFLYSRSFSISGETGLISSHVFRFSMSGPASEWEGPGRWSLSLAFYGLSDVDGDGLLDLILRVQGDRDLDESGDAVESIDTYGWSRNLGLAIPGQGSSQPRLLGDLNDDCEVSGADLGILLTAFGNACP